MKKDIIIVSLISFLVTGVMAILAYNFMPYEIYSLDDGMLGATITTINGSDKLKDTPAVLNANFANLNSDKLEISDFNATTSLPQITTLANLSTVGTIGTGTWNADTIPVSYGGTGATSFSNYHILMGAGSSAITVVATGTEDQVLTITGGVPAWQSGSTDETLDYAWTGYHTFTSATLASSTLASTTIKTNSVIYPTASSSIASKGYVDTELEVKAEYNNSNTTILSGGSATTFTDVDVSGTVGAKNTVLFCRYQTSADGVSFSYRKNGDTTTPKALTGYSNWQYITINTDSSGIFEYQVQSGYSATIVLLGYIN